MFQSHSMIILAALFSTVLPLFSADAVGAELTVERLTWAGVKFTYADTTVVIDAVSTDLWQGNAPGGLVPVKADTRRKYALITHTHNDHFDLDGLTNVLGERGSVICHESIASYVASRGLRVIAAKTWEPISRGGFVFTAVPAEDGLGEQQVSWVITVDGKRFLHAGDTLWHGRWATIGSLYGPFEAAFLPINGAQVLQEPMAETPAVLTPSQAVDAAALLRANRIVPIHYGLNDPPAYREVNEPLETTIAEGRRRGLRVDALQPGDFLDW